MIDASEQNNYETFRECLSDAVMGGNSATQPKNGKKKTTRGAKGRKNAHRVSASTDRDAASQEARAEELAEFMDVRTVARCPLSTIP